MSFNSFSSLSSFSSSAFKFGVIYYALPPGATPWPVEHLRELWGVAAPANIKDIKWEPYEEATDEPKLIARRANIGNIGRQAQIELTLSVDSNDEVLCKAFARFARSLANITSLDRGDLLLNTRAFDDNIRYNESIPRPIIKEPEISNTIIKPLEGRADDQCCIEPSAKSKRRKVLEENVCAGIAFGDEAVYNKTEPDNLAAIKEDWRIEEDLRQKEQQQREDFEQLQAQLLEYMIKYQADPQQLLKKLTKGKYIIQEDGLSPLVINENLDICLPDYDELVIDMSPLCKAIYILFLKHSDKGILLKEFADYRAEFEEIYSCVMANRNDKLARQSIDDLCDPTSNSLNEKKSKIKRYFKNKILDDNIARQYYITGRRGGPNRITLNPEMITIPAYFA